MPEGMVKPEPARKTMKGKFCPYVKRGVLICQEGECKACAVYLAWRQR